MVRLRFIFACMVMFAIPLQGFAAASMLFCGAGAGDHLARGAGAHGPYATAAADPDASADPNADGHAHAHAGQADVDQERPTLADGTYGAPAGVTITPGHKCGLCASCCHSVAISDGVHLVAITPIPRPAVPQPFVLLHTQPARVPDKPPRA